MFSNNDINYIQQEAINKYKEELREKINKILNDNIVMLDLDFGHTKLTYEKMRCFYKEKIKEEILELLK